MMMEEARDGGFGHHVSPESLHVICFYTAPQFLIFSQIDPTNLFYNQFRPLYALKPLEPHSNGRYRKKIQTNEEYKENHMTNILMSKKMDLCIYIYITVHNLLLRVLVTLRNKQIFS